MIERLLTSEGVEVETRFEILASGGVDVAELWTIHDSGELC
jgi:hypothetical protein